MRLDIRPFHHADIDAIYNICVRTGWLGTDVTSRYSDPLLLGHFYAAPYVKHDPALCLVATIDGHPSGYILGTADSVGFRSWAELQWFPTLRARYPLPPKYAPSADAIIIVRNVHAGYQPPTYSQSYPAHLHIDLLPCLQGCGIGTQLTHRFFDLLRARDCPAVHLIVNKANTRAMGFYKKFGFHPIEGSVRHQAFGFLLT